MWRVLIHEESKVDAVARSVTDKGLALRGVVFGVAGCGVKVVVYGGFTVRSVMFWLVLVRHGRLLEQRAGSGETVKGQSLLTRASRLFGKGRLSKRCLGLDGRGDE